MEKDAVIKMNTDTLAYMGDAVYEVYVREQCLKSGEINPNRLHKNAVRYVRAAAQAAAIKQLFDELPQEEQRLVKRARNHKSTSRPKNADPVEYKWATALEALIGYLHLSGEREKLQKILEKVFNIIETEDIK